MKVLLISMPWVSLARPAIGISLLKARLREEGIACDVRYGNLLFASTIGRETYELVNDHLSPALFLGDWLFAQYLFGAQLDLETYAATLRHHDAATPHYHRLMAIREEIGRYLVRCLDEFDIASYDIVGFTTTFEQNCASLALAQLVKRRYPEKVIVFGGANCDGIMGVELHRSFPWIDYICPGEADYTFPALVQRLAQGLAAHDLPGVIARHGGGSDAGADFGRGGESRLGGAPPVIRDMDALPDPDYDDYFAALARTPYRDDIQPALLIESARGCWWGAKSHCTFCGLNGSTMAFRSKGAGRVYDELRRQKARYGISRFLAVDNIMSFGYFKDLLPRLKADPLGVSLFYEIKSNLKREQVQLLREAGVLALQPGIESLNTHVLRLMGKGVSAIQNVQLLKFCREFGIEVAWNLLFGFPGETPDDYAQTAHLIESVYHLKPPGTVAAIRLDRFSPNFDQADRFGLVNVRPFALYPYLYPLPPERVANLAYFFEYEHADGRTADTYLRDTLEKVDVWKANQAGDLFMENGGDRLRLTDTRPGGGPREFVLEGVQKRLYEYCEEIRTRDHIHAYATQIAGGPDALAAVDTYLDELVQWRLMMREGHQFLSLAVPVTQ